MKHFIVAIYTDANKSLIALKTPADIVEPVRGEKYHLEGFALCVNAPEQAQQQYREIKLEKHDIISYSYWKHGELKSKFAEIVGFIAC